MLCMVLFFVVISTLVNLSLRRTTPGVQHAEAGPLASKVACGPPSSSTTRYLVEAIRTEEAKFIQGSLKRSKTCNASAGDSSGAATELVGKHSRLLTETANEGDPEVRQYPVRLLIPTLTLHDQEHAVVLQKLTKLVASSCGRIREVGPFGGVQVELLSETKDAVLAEIIDAAKEAGLEPEPDFSIVPAGEVTPNDPLFSNLWGVSKVKLPEAWSLEHTGELVQETRPVVCVSDTGVDYTHEDLYDNIYVNEEEMRGFPFVDDDNNGYVDDIYGVNVFERSEADNPMDAVSHGSHVAGIVGAVGNNAKGLAGAAWKPRLIPCKFIGKTPGSVSGAVECIAYCVGRKARVSVHSYVFPRYSATLLAAMEWAEKKAMIMVFAAGNGSTDLGITPSYPACYSDALSGALAVANLQQSEIEGVLNPASNYGRCIHLACPGTGIVSTLNSQKGPAYGVMEGTSMAAALMAGIVTLMTAVNPDLSPVQCRKYVQTCIVELPAVQNRVRWHGIPDALCCVHAALTGSALRVLPIWGVIAVTSVGLAFIFSVNA